MPGGALRLLRTAILVLVFVAPGGFAAEIDDLVTLCEDCHGPGGVSTDPDVPIIAGQPTDFLRKTMRTYQVWGRPCIHSAFRHGDVERPPTDMCEIAEGLTADEITALAEHFSALPFQAAAQPYDAELAAAGEVLHHQKCEMCHKQGGRVPDHGPRIAGQWVPYLRTTLKFVPTGEHLVPPAMETIIDDLNPGEIDALTNYYASQQD
jgi:sulfide dehydrogenase cytochrome subunit